MRPGDANEVIEAWRVIMPLRHDPVALILSRQPMPTLDGDRYAPASGVAQGGYVLAGDPDATPDVILIASGTEVGLAVDAYEQLIADDIAARVVSMASMELFDRQSTEYRESVLPPAVTARVVIEQGTAFGLDRWAGTTGKIIAMSTFGASAPLKALQAKFGFTVTTSSRRRRVSSEAQAMVPRTSMMTCIDELANIRTCRAAETPTTRAFAIAGPLPKKFIDDDVGWLSAAE